MTTITCSLDQLEERFAGGGANEFRLLDSRQEERDGADPELIEITKLKEAGGEAPVLVRIANEWHVEGFPDMLEFDADRERFWRERAAAAGYRWIKEGK